MNDGRGAGSRYAAGGDPSERAPPSRGGAASGGRGPGRGRRGAGGRRSRGNGVRGAGSALGGGRGTPSAQPGSPGAEAAGPAGARGGKAARVREEPPPPGRGNWLRGGVPPRARPEAGRGGRPRPAPGSPRDAHSRGHLPAPTRGPAPAPGSDSRVPSCVFPLFPLGLGTPQGTDVLGSLTFGMLQMPKLNEIPPGRGGREESRGEESWPGRAGPEAARRARGARGQAGGEGSPWDR